GSEQEEFAELRPVQWLNSEAITHQCERTVAPVPHANSEHADEALHCRVDPVEGKCLEHDLGIGTAAKPNATRLTLAAQFVEIIDCAVVRDDQLSIRRDHRLMAGCREVDDRESAVGEGNAGLGIAPEAMIVGTAIGDAVGHHDRVAFKPFARGGCKSQNAGNAAHYLVRRLNWAGMKSSTA